MVEGEDLVDLALVHEESGGFEEARPCLVVESIELVDHHDSQLGGAGHACAHSCCYHELLAAAEGCEGAEACVVLEADVEPVAGDLDAWSERALRQRGANAGDRVPDLRDGCLLGCGDDLDVLVEAGEDVLGLLLAEAEVGDGCGVALGCCDGLACLVEDCDLVLDAFQRGAGVGALVRCLGDHGVGHSVLVGGAAPLPDGLAPVEELLGPLLLVDGDRLRQGLQLLGDLHELGLDLVLRVDLRLGVGLGDGLLACLLDLLHVVGCSVGPLVRLAGLVLGLLDLRRHAFLLGLLEIGEG